MNYEYTFFIEGFSLYSDRRQSIRYQGSKTSLVSYLQAEGFHEWEDLTIEDDQGNEYEIRERTLVKLNTNIEEGDVA